MLPQDERLIERGVEALERIASALEAMTPEGEMEAYVAWLRRDFPPATDPLAKANRAVMNEEARLAAEQFGR